MSKVQACTCGLFLIGLLLLSVRIQVMDAIAVAGLISTVAANIATMISPSILPSRGRRTRSTDGLPPSAPEQSRSPVSPDSAPKS